MGGEALLQACIYSFRRVSFLFVPFSNSPPSLFTYRRYSTVLVYSTSRFTLLFHPRPETTATAHPGLRTAIFSVGRRNRAPTRWQHAAHSTLSPTGRPTSSPTSTGAPEIELQPGYTQHRAPSFPASPPRRSTASRVQPRRVPRDHRTQPIRPSTQQEGSRRVQRAQAPEIKTRVQDTRTTTRLRHQPSARHSNGVRPTGPLRERSSRSRPRGSVTEDAGGGSSTGSPHPEAYERAGRAARALHKTVRRSFRAQIRGPHPGRQPSP